MRLVCCLVLLLGGLQLTCALFRVAAWNIKTFGTTKINKANIMTYIANLIKVDRQYDVIVIQEVIDNTPNPPLPVVEALMDLLNPTTIPATGAVYAHIVSGPLGDPATTYRERYLYVYNTGTVTHVNGDIYQYPDIKNDFVRPPFAAKFTVPGQSGQQSFDFVMIPLHAKPGSGETYKEINALDDVVQGVKANWISITNILLLGDFNAGPPFLPQKDNDQITLKNGYKWLIGDTARTNLAASSKPYDRIVATTAMLAHVAPNQHTGAGATATTYQAQPYDFVNAGNLPTTINAKDVSDHFPVEVELL